MLNRLFPQHADNSFRGHRLAIWFYGLVLLLKFYLALDAIFNGGAMAAAGDGIPLGAFPGAGIQAVVALYALWGLVHLMLWLLGVIVLVRHRSLIPAMLALFLLEHLGRKLVLHYLPISPGGPSGQGPGISPVPYGFLVLIIVGLALSLWSRDKSRGAQ